MGGFQNQLLNQNFKQKFYNKIITALINGCKLMVDDCYCNSTTIPNHEEKIRTYLLENYLENDMVRHSLELDDVPIRFLPEVLENYDKATGTYVGRTDIRVVSDDWLRNGKDYYIIECKRIDGTKVLNKKYVDEGICRFIGSPPKYSSYNNRNIMLGFVVKNIDYKIVVSEISNIHDKKIGGFITPIKSSKDYYLCESIYTNELVLGHIFYNISNIVSI